MDNFHYLFLVYVGRSGSTYLAKKIAQHTDQILVFAETKLLDNLSQISEEEFQCMEDSSRLDIIKKDPRWTNLSVCEQTLLSICQTARSRLDVVHQIVKFRQIDAGIDSRYVLFKNGASLWNFKKLESFVGQGKTSLIHIKRDPRGSTASRMNKKPVYKAKAGARLEDPWYLARFWVSYIENVHTIKKQGTRVLDVTYEDLIDNPDACVKQLFTALEVEYLSVTSNTYNLSDKERRAKHSNVEKRALTSRTTAWQTELPTGHGIVIEYLCANHIENQYFSNDTSSVHLWLAISKGFCMHWLYNTQRAKEKFLSLVVR